MSASIRPSENAEADAGPAREAAFVVNIDGYAGPLDVLLTLAREQKVDLAQISIVQLAEQYLAFVAAARRLDLDLAAEYLVMAAWLAYLKSRLMVPRQGGTEEPSSEEMAAALARQLQRLDAMREAGVRLMARPRRDRDFVARGCGEAAVSAAAVRTADDSSLSVARIEVKDMLAAYARVLGGQASVRPLRLDPADLSSVEDAIERIRRALGVTPGWEILTCYLPADTLAGLRAGRLRARSDLAATFSACLELARQGVVVLRQSRPFGPIFLKASPGGRSA
jgi:segregation and condensation protein A